MSATNHHDPNTGVLFPNAEKWIAEKEGRPDFGGELETICQCCGKTSRFRVSAWNNVGKQSGKAFIAIKLSKPAEKGARK